MFPAPKETAPAPRQEPLTAPQIPRPARAPMLKPGVLQVAEYVRQHYFVTVPNDVTMGMLLTPAYWGNYLQQLRRFDVIEVCREDGAIDVQLRVISNGDGMVRVVLRQNRDSTVNQPAPNTGATSETLTLPDGYKVKQTPGQGTYFVQDGKTGATIKTGLVSKNAAIEFAIEHKRASETSAPVTGLAS